MLDLLADLSLSRTIHTKWSDLKGETENGKEPCFLTAIIHVIVTHEPRLVI